MERSRLATISFTGSYAGAVLGLPLSGIMTERISWESSFYFYGEWYICIYGIRHSDINLKESRPSRRPLDYNNVILQSLKGVVGMIWLVFWWLFSYERPANCPTISEEERIYIEESIGESSSLATKVGANSQDRTFIADFYGKINVFKTQKFNNSIL
jgi:ACS family sodium-dependent inorganic phosphate cotransporter-like MFS transporter 6/7/8